MEVLVCETVREFYMDLVPDGALHPAIAMPIAGAIPLPAAISHGWRMAN
jgi:hypothetical protein